MAAHQPRNEGIGTHFCRHCDHRVTPSRPGSALGFAAALIAASIGMLIMVLASSLIGPFIVGVLPLMALYGFALGPLHWLATMPATCTGCAREVIYRSREEARAAHPIPRRAELRRAG